ncbi:hypothetical protein [Paenimyroides aestuarii]|uniref:Uncharacterized protein n=1 Tax=Paenimyroides aestuarii TaxID=2968490 RepID=A0ABY5NVQ4_9FLAO|nr:hypothetical protein [Paenimyroides aestuarii]UUV22409.1 hypothetical protein NPX36_05055 [Paenimyroides aestuarii]
MKKIFILLMSSLWLISCTSDDFEPKEEVNRGTVEVDFKGEKLNFGYKSYNGIVTNQTNDTVAYTYFARLDKDDMNYYDIKVYAFLTKDKELDHLEMKFIPVENGSGSGYHYSYEENPMVYSNVTYNPETNWLTANFEGYLYYGRMDDSTPIHLTNGKINVPVKGLGIEYDKW